MGTLKDALDEDAREVDTIWMNLPCRNQVFHLPEEELIEEIK